mgnify:CR=1 FL=1
MIWNIAGEIDKDFNTQQRTQINRIEVCFECSPLRGITNIKEQSTYRSFSFLG